jgi:uncharacterized protein YbjT (DUF2867 family)
MTRASVNPVLVIGGTGRIGRVVTAELLRGGVPVRVLTRRPATAGLPPSVEVVAGDVTVPESLDDGLRDVSLVFLVWTAPPSTVQAVVARLASHARRLVFLSSPHQVRHPFFEQPNPMASFHAEVERSIAAAGIESTILRPGLLASNARYWCASMIRESDVVRWPYGAAETSPIDDRDIAAVAARALCDNEYAGGDYVLTGPESLSQAEQVRTIADVLGRPIGFEEVSPEEFRRDMMRRSPGSWVDMLLTAWRATLGHPAFVTSAVTEVMGSAPRTFHQWAADHVEAFR